MSREAKTTPQEIQLGGYGSSLRAVTATEAKNGLGQLLATLHHGAIAITSHDSPKAVLISIDDFLELVGREERQLNTLNDEFDALLDSMQGGSSRAKLQAAFAAPPGGLGKAAIAKSKRRG